MENLKIGISYDRDASIRAGSAAPGAAPDLGPIYDEAATVSVYPCEQAGQSEACLSCEITPTDPRCPHHLDCAKEICNDPCEKGWAQLDREGNRLMKTEETNHQNGGTIEEK